MPPSSVGSGAEAGAPAALGGQAGEGSTVGGATSAGSGGLDLAVGAQSGTAGMEGGLVHTLCDNELVEALLPSPIPPLGFDGTFDDEPTELFEESHTSGLPTFQILHNGRRLTAMSFGFAVKATPYSGYLQVRSDGCRLVGTLFPLHQAGVMDFSLQVGSLSSTTVSDWHGGIVTGTVHAEFEHAPSGERHVLDGAFTFEAGLSDSNIGN